MTITGIQTAQRPLPADQLIILVRRSLRTSARVPQLLMFSLTMPMAMLVLFSQVFRSVADGPAFPPGVSYIDFLTPAMLAVSTVMAGTNAGVAAAIDHTNGLHDRFATLPVPAWVPGAARTLNEALFTLARGALLLAAAMVLGFRFHGTRPRRRVRNRRGHDAGRGDERPVRSHRRSLASPRRRPVRRDDDHDAVDVRLGGVRAAKHDAGLDARSGVAEPRRPRRARAPGQRPGNRHPRRHGHRARGRRPPLGSRNAASESGTGTVMIGSRTFGHPGHEPTLFGPDRHDVVVVGAPAAGAATALLSRLRGGRSIGGST